MKQICLIILLLSGLFILYSCTPIYDDNECTYEYPVNIKNLKDTIKTTDTLWVENDFDARFCLKEGVYKNGVAKEHPRLYKLINDSLIDYLALIIGYDEAREKGYTIYIREQGGRYKSRYGIVFSEKGIYVLRAHSGRLENKKDPFIWLQGYYNTPTNNIYLIPVHLQNFDNDFSQKEPYQYRIYCIAVVE